MNIQDIVGNFSDPRHKKNQLYPFETLMLCAICAIMAGEDSFSGMAEYSENNLDRLSQFVSFPYDYGPSHDLFRWLFDLLNPEELSQWIMDLTAKIIDNDTYEIEHVAIDGKTIRNSKNNLHFVHAFCTKNRLLLCQEKVDEKSNEITAIPKILDLLDLAGLTITIDAMGCQRSICKKIVDGEGDYLIAVKDNQPSLFEDVQGYFKMYAGTEEVAQFTHIDKGHGRFEKRICSIIKTDHWLQKEHDWPGLRHIVHMHRIVEKKHKQTTEDRFYITSLNNSCAFIAQIIRDHWIVENGLHYVLDVTFNEDKSCIRNDNLALNMSTLRKLSMNVLQHAKPNQASMKSMVRKCSNPIKAIEFLINFYRS